MEYKVAISPELGLSSKGFVNHWNSTADSSELASAELRQAAPKGFPIDPELLNQGIIILTALGSFAGGIAVDVFKDVIKEKVTGYLSQKKPEAPTIQVESIRQPDGSYLFVIDEK